MFAVLHALRIRGFATAEALAESTGLDPGVVAEDLAAMAADGLVVHRDGRVSGWRLTEDGTALHGELLMANTDDHAAVERFQQAFFDLNAEMKQICTDWQVKPGAEVVLNDHADPAYDAAVVARLGALDDQVGPPLTTLAGAEARFGTYGPRLAAARRRFEAGEHDALAKPLAGSYHDAWMELHQDLLLTLGRERDERDGH
ncbi:MAG: MarR family transcriptional regulator [Acidimicrobiia bacterium]